MKVVTVRIDDKYFEDLKEIEKEEQVDRAEVMRKLLTRAIKEWKIKKAIELLREHKVTIRKAASIAEVGYAEMFDLASNADIDIGYDLKELRKDINGSN